jgi:anti-sigma28 factor (negative regulator of flagellin synthesis)
MSLKTEKKYKNSFNQRSIQMKNLNERFAFDVDIESNSHFVKGRFKKLERIKKAVLEGSYKVNSKKLANILILKLISELAPLDCPDLYLSPCPVWKSCFMQPLPPRGVER